MNYYLINYVFSIILYLNNHSQENIEHFCNLLVSPLFIRIYRAFYTYTNVCVLVQKNKRLLSYSSSLGRFITKPSTFNSSLNISTKLYSSFFITSGYTAFVVLIAS